MATSITSKTKFVGINHTIKELVRDLEQDGLANAWVKDQSGTLIGNDSLSNVRDLMLNKGIQASSSIETILNKEFAVGKTSMTYLEILDIAKEHQYTSIPIVNNEGKVVDILDVSAPVSSNKTKNGIKKVLVTGAAGYIGSLLVRQLLDRGYEVVVLDKLTYGDQALRELLFSPKFELIKGDLAHVEDVMKAIKGVDAVVHLAGIVGDPACGLDPHTTLQYNLHSTLNLAQICKYHQINRFVFASSCSVYGTGEEVLNEQSDLNPVSLYAQDKINCEKALLNLMDENFCPTFMRMGTIHGLSARPRFDLVVNILTAFGTKENKFTIFGGDQWRPFVHVADAARSYIHVLEAPMADVRGEAFNVGSNGENYKIIDVGHAVKEVIPSAEMIISTQQTDIRNYRVNFDKITSVLGFKAEKTIYDGINEIREHMLNNPEFNFKDNYYSNIKSFKEVLANQTSKVEQFAVVN